MTQTWALFVDGYRELNSKKLFWITLILSGVVVLACGMLGINDKGITFLHWQFETPVFTTELMSPAEFYKMIFASMAIPFWLTWVAAILALVSTGSIFPDFIASGSIELTLSKPIGRVRLFLTKYATGLLFAGLQVLVFTVAAFLVIGIRGGAWEWPLFIAVPIVVIFFSYLFSICVLLGIITRSAIASILLTLLIWFGISMLAGADSMLMMFKTQAELRAEDARKTTERLEVRLGEMQALLAEAQADEAMSAQDREARVASLAGRIANTEQSIQQQRAEVQSGLRSAEQIDPWHDGVVMARTVLPKTGDTIGLLQRWLVDMANLPGMQDGESAPDAEDAFNSSQNDPRLNRAMQEKINERPVWWIIGTSLGFEAVILAIGAWLFARRDF